MLLPCKLMRLLVAFMGCGSLQANHVPDPSTCTKWPGGKYLQNKNVSTYLTQKRGKNNICYRLGQFFYVTWKICKMRFRLRAAL